MDQAAADLPVTPSHTTRQFMAACAIMQRVGRPGSPTDQARIESLFGSRQERVAAPETDPLPRQARRRARMRPALSPTSPCCKPGLATSPPTTSTTAAATPSAKPGPTP
jgi:transposase InsO family protein